MARDRKLVALLAGKIPVYSSGQFNTELFKHYIPLVWLLFPTFRMESQCFQNKYKGGRKEGKDTKITKKYGLKGQ